MGDIFKINDIEYDCEFTLSNPDNQKVKFTKSAIRGMTLIDNIFEPFLSGTISIANPYDFVEDEYFIRGDGRDELTIKFKPKEPKGKDEFFEHVFVIVDDGNLSKPTTRAESIKTFNLICKHSIKFMDLFPYNKKCVGKIGKILQDIFKELLGDDKVDMDNWEEGDFEIEYYPPATHRYIDVLYYLLRLFYAKDGDLNVKGFISWDDISGKYRMDLLSKVYDKHNDNVIEGFALGDLTSKIDTNNPNNPPPGPPVGEYIGAMKNLGYSSPSYEWVNEYFINGLVFGYDKILGSHQIRKLEFKDVKKKWSKKFVEPFKSIGGKPQKFAIENQTTDKKFKRYKFPYDVDDCVKVVEADMINALTFFNLQVSFSNIGNTIRRSGKFIDIFSTRGDTKLKSDEKVLGRWFVTEVRHVFFADLYTNQIFATKTYIGPKSNVREDVE